MTTPASADACEGVPPLAEFLRWMAEMPAAFRAEPRGFPGGALPVRAVVADLYETLFNELADAGLLEAFEPSGSGKVARNRLFWILAACHVLWHPALRAGPVTLEGFRKLLVQDMAGLAAAIPAERLIDEEERREELVRLTLAAFGRRLPGESLKEAEDRLTQVDSVGRQRLLHDAAEKAARAREVREMMARKAAEEAAAKVSRE